VSSSSLPVSSSVGLPARSAAWMATATGSNCLDEQADLVQVLPALVGVLSLGWSPRCKGSASCSFFGFHGGLRFFSGIRIDSAVFGLASSGTLKNRARARPSPFCWRNPAIGHCQWDQSSRMAWAEACPTSSGGRVVDGSPGPGCHVLHCG
jgi:hypothetical protein